MLRHINISGSRRKIELIHLIFVTLTLHNVILPLERRAPGPGCLLLRGFVAASFVEGMGEVAGVHLPQLFKVTQGCAQIPVLAWMGRQQQRSPSRQREIESIPKALEPSNHAVHPEAGRLSRRDQEDSRARATRSAGRWAPVQDRRSGRDAAMNPTCPDSVGSAATAWREGSHLVGTGTRPQLSGTPQC